MAIETVQANIKANKGQFECFTVRTRIGMKTLVKWPFSQITSLVCITVQFNVDTRQFQAFLTFLPKLSRIRVQFHCNANVKYHLRKGLLALIGHFQVGLRRFHCYMQLASVTGRTEKSLLLLNIPMIIYSNP